MTHTLHSSARVILRLKDQQSEITLKSPANVNLKLVTGAGGANGTPGVGVPAGGTAGQFLRKNSAVDYDFGFALPSGGARHEHQQPSAAAVWNINHNFGFRPDITLFSAGGVQVVAEILHLNLNQATATFDIPFSGMAICE